MTNPDRVAFTLFGKDIYWYGVLMAIGIVIAVIIAQSEEKRKKLPKDIVIDMCLAIIPAGIIGARLYYVLFELDRYLADPIKILYIWEGGLAIYGAVIFGLIAAAIFAHVRKVRFLALADVIVPGLVLAQAIGRWGNFFNQEAYGLPVTQAMLAKFPILNYFPFSVSIDGAHYFDDALCTACYTTAAGGHLHLATFFYESAWCLIVFVFIMLMRKRFKHDGDAFIWYGLLYSFERMFVEGLRGDSLWLIRPDAAGVGGIRVSQLVSAIVFAAALTFLIIRAVKEKKEGRLMWPAPVVMPASEAQDAACGEQPCGETEGEPEGESGDKPEKDGEAEKDGESEKDESACEEKNAQEEAPDEDAKENGDNTGKE